MESSELPRARVGAAGCGVAHRHARHRQGDTAAGDESLARDGECGGTGRIEAALSYHENTGPSYSGRAFIMYITPMIGPAVVMDPNHFS